MKKFFKSKNIIPWITTTLILSAILMAIAGFTSSSEFQNAGQRINTNGDDFAPSITADGSIIIFNSKALEERSHNIFISRKIKGSWSDPVPIPEICSLSNDETPFISHDGKILLFASERPGGFSPPATADNIKRITFDIYISYFDGVQWSAPILLPGDVNTSMNERAPSLSPDGKFLFFTRWPYKNLSKSKIYMAELTNGKYENIRELPSSINSGNYEIGFYPSYKEKNKYYFASKREGGYGGWDIYSVLFDGKNFSAVKNAGPSINTVFDEVFFAESQFDAVLSSNRVGGYGGYDLYLKTDSKIDYSPQKISPKNEDNPEKWEPLKETDKSSSDLKKEFLEKKSYISPTIYFDFGSYKIKPDYIPELYKLVEFLRAHPDKWIVIKGFADPPGTKRTNKRLSYKRAQAVKDYLVEMGIDCSRISITAEGEKPIKAKRLKNKKDPMARRVNIIIKSR